MMAAEDEEIEEDGRDGEEEATPFSDLPSCSRIGVTWLNKVSICRSLVSSSWTYLKATDKRRGIRWKILVNDILSAERGPVFRLQPSALGFRSYALCTRRFVAVALDFLSPEDGLFISGVMMDKGHTCSLHKPSRLSVVGLGRS
jgi:hypothetical protein